MATLILTAVGSAVGGPIGSAVGAIVGQAIDQMIFAPKARHGPRLGDLAVQTSSYGAAIPKLFGTMRVAGIVIWSTDLIESRSSTGGGKGRPKTVNYSYSASFAVALSGRPIRAVRRIWADGKLLRGAAGDFKIATGFRLYSGGEDQEPDPLIAAAEGAGQAPGFRGLAYATFEDFQLAEYGNRIPSLTFEVEADQGAIAIGTIAETLSEHAVEAGNTPEVGGYAASGDSVRSALEGLMEVVPLSLRDTGAALALSVPEEEAILLERREELFRRKIVRRSAASAPAEVSLAYYEIERDFQTGLQRASRGSGPPTRTEQRALPAALSAGAAKGFAEHRLASAWAERSTAEVRFGWSRADLQPGMIVRLEGEAGSWRIARWTLGAMTVALELVRTAPAAVAATASPGRTVAEHDLLHGGTLLRFADLPLGIESDLSRPLLVGIAGGAEAGWRSAALQISYDGGTSWEAAGRTGAPAVLGSALNTLPPSGPALFDRRTSVEVELANEAMWLESRSEAALAGGANLALLGDELIQFGSVEVLNERRFRLSNLLRGRRGTEWAASLHAAGEPFALIERDALVAIPLPDGAMGGTARLMASGIGDEMPVEAEVPITGESLRPPSPVHLRTVRTAGGDLIIDWVRRSRQGWIWSSSSDTPLGEERESYRIAISGGGGPERLTTTGEPRCVYTAAEQAADGRNGAITIAVQQIGTHAASRPAERTIS